MKRTRILAMFLFIVLLFSAMVLPAGAAFVPAEGPSSEERLSPRDIICQSIADAANVTIERMVERAQNDPNADIDRLVAETSAVSTAAIRLIRMLGGDAECKYDLYVINGVEVWIDPIIIIKRTAN